MNPDHWSLRRRLVLSMAATSVLGYIVFNVAWYLLAHAWQPITGYPASFATLSLPGIDQNTGPNWSLSSRIITCLLYTSDAADE